MPKVMIVPRELAKFAHKFRDVLDRAGLEVVALPPAGRQERGSGQGAASSAGQS